MPTELGNARRKRNHRLRSYGATETIGDKAHPAHADTMQAFDFRVINRLTRNYHTAQDVGFISKCLDHASVIRAKGARLDNSASLKT